MALAIRSRVRPTEGNTLDRNLSSLVKSVGNENYFDLTQTSFQVQPKAGLGTEDLGL